MDRTSKSADTDAGPVLAGKYRLLSLLGQGGMGTVWRAEHLGLGAPVAIKLIDPKVASGPEAVRLGQKEARAAAALRSPHVVQVLDFGVDETTGGPFIVMELLEGESLADRLRRVGKLSPGETARVVTHVTRALSRAHEAGIVHRDLKPPNVFMVHNEDEELAKVLDFGTARVQRAGALAETGMTTGALVGTPFYMSPEHISGRQVDHRTDLWAVAVMAFECLLGRRPFIAKDVGAMVLQICTYPIPIPSQHGPVPAGFDAWFLRATAREPDNRFQSARELAEELRHVCGGTGTTRAPGTADEDRVTVRTEELEPDPPSPPPPRATSSRRRVARAVIAVAVLVVGIAGLAMLVRRTPSRVTEGAPAPALAAPPVAVPASAAPVAPAGPMAPAPAPAAPVMPAARETAGSGPPAGTRRVAKTRPSRRAARLRTQGASPAARPGRSPAPVTAAPLMESVLDHRR